MNSLNLKQIDGGNIIKQADSGSMFKFELLDENHKKFEEQLDDTATVILKQGTVAVFKKIVAVTDNCVTFNLDKILEVGDYILEIIVGGYVFPSNNRLKISVESTYGDYQPENLVRITYEEIDEKINALTDRLDDLNVAVQTEMMNRIVALEQKEDKDTVYDDAKIKNSIDSLKSTVEQNEVNVNQELLGIGQNQAKINDRLDVLESKEDKDTVYDDSEIKRRVSALEERPTVEPYDDSEVKNRLNALEKKEDRDTIYDDTDIKVRLTALESKEDKDTVYDDTNVKQSISDVNGRVDKLSNKVSVLEDRPIVEPYDDTNVVSRIESLEGKVDKDTIYDDSELRNRIVVLENKPDNDTIYDDSEIKQKIAEIEANAPAVHLAYADSEDGSAGFTKFKPQTILNATFLDSTKRFIGMSVKDSNDYRDYVWIPNPELSKNWQYYELASTILDDCNKEYSSIYNFDTVTYLEAINGAKVDKINPYFILKQKEQNSNNVLSIRYRNSSNPVFSFIAEQDGGFDNDWYLVDTNDNKMYIRSGLNIFMASPKAIGKDGDIVNPLKIRNTLLYSANGLVFNFAMTQDEIIKITTIVHNTSTSRYTLYQKIMNGIVLYAYPQGSVVLMQNDTSPNGLLKRGIWSKLGELTLTNPDGKLTAWVRSL